MDGGERFFESPELVRKWLDQLPMTDVPTEFVVLKPLPEVAEHEHPELVVFLVNADQLSALVIATDYRKASGEPVVARFGGACQAILWGYEEAKRDRPRGVIGFFDIAMRHVVDRETLAFTAPWALYRELEGNVAGSFLELEDWLALRDRSRDPQAG